MPLSARFPFVLAALLALVLLALPVMADDPEPADPPAKAEEGADAEVGEGETEASAERPALHKIYVPFRDLSKVFEKEGEGVFLPYDEFLALWRKANAVDAEAKAPPVKAALRAAAYVGEADGEMVTLKASLEVEVLASGWQRLGLDFAGAGIETATLDGKPALLVPAGKGYELLLREEGRRTLELTLRIPATRKGDKHTATFALPPVPLSRLTLSVPGSATEVEVTPRLASTTRAHDDTGRTQLVAFLGPVSKISMSWRQKVDEGPRVEPLVFAEERHDVHANRGVLRSELTADLSILRAPLEKLEIVVPADAVTLYVKGDGIRTWERSDDGTRISVELREPVKESWQLRLGLQRALPELPASIVLPLAGIEGIERETGYVRLLMGEGVQVEPLETPDLLQVDVTELPDPLKGAPPGRSLAYRFPDRPGAVRIRIDALEPRLVATANTWVQIRPEGVDAVFSANLAVEREGIFGVAFDISAGLEITSVRVSGVEYNDHKVKEEDGKRVLIVEFRDRLLGNAGITIQGRVPSPLPEGEEENDEVEFSVPLYVLRDADVVTGYLGVHLDSAVEHRAILKTGLVVVDANAPQATVPTPVQAPLAYRFEHHEGDIALTLGLKRRAPAVTASVETGFRLEPDRTRLETTLRYVVRYRGIDTMRFTAPLGAGARMHLDLEGAELIGPEPIEGGEVEGEVERGIWTIKLPAPRTGEIPLTLEFEDLPEEALASGETRSLVLPSFVPLAEDGKPLPNTVHHVAVRRDPLLEADPESLEFAEEIDARELPPALRSDDNFLAFRAYDARWQVGVLVTRHDYAPVAEIVISHMHLDTVVPTVGKATTEAYLEVRNNDRQYLELQLPPDVKKTRASTVDGQKVTLRTGENGSFLVPLLSGLGKAESFVVAIAYDHDVARSSSFGFDTTWVPSPVALGNVKADLLTWRVWAPEDRVYTSFGGTVPQADPYQSWFGTLVSDLSQTLGRRAPTGTVDVSGLAGGYKSPFKTRHEGTKFEFLGRAGTGMVEFTGTAATTFALWKLLWFGALLVLTLLLAAFAGKIGLGEGTMVTAIVLILLVLLVRAQPGMAQVLNAMLYGALAAGLIRLFGNVLRRQRQRRADRPLPDAPTTPTAPSAPSDGSTPAAEGGAA